MTEAADIMYDLNDTQDSTPNTGSETPNEVRTPQEPESTQDADENTESNGTLSKEEFINRIFSLSKTQAEGFIDKLKKFKVGRLSFVFVVY